MTIEMFAVLDSKFDRHPALATGPTNPERIEELEQFAGFRLPSAYKEFVRRYGGAIVGSYPVFGIGASEIRGAKDGSAIQVTERFRFDRWPGTEVALVVSIDHAGNPITMDRGGAVSRFDHDSGTSEKLASSFEDFVLHWCLKVT